MPKMLLWDSKAQETISVLEKGIFKKFFIILIFEVFLLGS